MPLTLTEVHVNKWFDQTISQSTIICNRLADLCRNCDFYIDGPGTASLLLLVPKAQ